MKSNQTSSTAIWVNAMRAMHQQESFSPQILVDPIAPKFHSVLGDSELQAKIESLPDALKLSGIGMLVHRTRYTEEVLQSVATKGPCQYIILGAGYDTFAYRQPEWAKAVQIIEVDHPSTQASKKELLAELSIPTPSNLTFCPCNFEETTLEEALQDIQIDKSIPTVFCWLGVVHYITMDAIHNTLDSIASFCKGSAVVFSFLLKEDQLPESEKEAMKLITKVVEESGEPFISLFTYSELEQLLQKKGFNEIEFLTAKLAQERYYQNRTDGLKPPYFEQVLSAFL